ncbi:MAG TPA: hypothetical protein PLF22_01105 [Pseudomonadales bacterium]|nr:hypothetical protein [Pseudomonadales bacterium]
MHFTHEHHGQDGAFYARLLQPWVVYPFVLVASVFLALTTYLQPGSEIVEGLDASWAYGLNYIYAKGLVMGRDIYFTFGPLGFLMYSMPIDGKPLIAISSLFWFCVSILQCFLVLDLVFRQRRARWNFLLDLLAGVAVICLANAHEYRLLLIAYVLVFLHGKTGYYRYLVLLAFISALCIAIKFSFGAVALSLFGPYLLWASWTARSPRIFIIGVLSFLVFYLAIWLLLYGSFSGVMGYVQGGLAFSQGSTSAMATNPANDWLAIANFYLLLVASLFVLSRGEQGAWNLTPLCFIGPLFIWSKYAFGLEDAEHLSFLMSFVFLSAFIFFITVTDIKRKLVVPVVVMSCFVSWRAMHTHIADTAYTPDYVYYPSATFRSRLDIDRLNDYWIQRTEEGLKPLRVPENLRTMIGDKTVDIYPWESVIAQASHLNWLPRPIFQNYITYTPFLDEKNREFYSGTRAPAFVLWHFHSFQDIANRYGFSTDPLTIDAIFRHYQIEKCDGPYCLFSRQQQEQLTKEKAVGSIVAHWDEWIPVKDFQGDILRAHTTIQRNWLGKLNMALWKEGGVSIDYRLKNGETRTHDLVVDNAVSGIWVSPYIEHFSIQAVQPQPIDKPVLEKILALPHAEGYVDHIEDGFSGPRISGWGFLPFKDTPAQHVSVILFNETHAYKAPVDNRLRPGIAQNYPDKKGVNLEYTGFDKEIVAGDIKPGEYAVRFMVENGGESAVSDNQNMTLRITDKHQANNVDAIRLHSLRAWAFEPDIMIDWVTVGFTGKNPLQ